MSAKQITIWGAVGPNGQIVKSSVGTFQAVARRWAAKHRGFKVKKLGDVTVSVPDLPDHREVVEKAKAKRLVGRPNQYPIRTR